LASDHNSRTRSVNGYANGIPRPLDHNFRDCRILQLLLHVVANLQIVVQKRGKFLWRSVPARAPVAIHVQAEPDWINFLSHNVATSLRVVVIPSEVEGSRGETATVTSRDSSTPLRFAQNDNSSLTYLFGLLLAFLSDFLSPDAFSVASFLVSFFVALFSACRFAFRVSRVSMAISSESTMRM